ncbi:MAG: hypothetical protein HC896_16970 [Bacteroidales bacterium]|nr:hypothetical protein [Bacteroidales bacterium]
MATKIRKATPEDINGISALYHGRKSLEEIKWLYDHPGEEDGFSSFVAENEGEIVGVVGYVLSNYSFNDKTFVGISHISWMVSQKARGMVGVQLLMNALKR